jgi:hypothetical protein
MHMGPGDKHKGKGDQVLQMIAYAFSVVEQTLLICENFARTYSMQVNFSLF